MSSFMPANNDPTSLPHHCAMDEASTPRPDSLNLSASNGKSLLPRSTSVVVDGNDLDQRSSNVPINNNNDNNNNNNYHHHNISEDSSSRPSTSRDNNHHPSATEEMVGIGESDIDREGCSDHEAEPGGDAGPPSKKKKGQRFFCTDFPPCNLSFTRSEHLARHIRKHTGERPFQCHCSRRFSRLDNLRQHAQTVHVNEDIPGDSLAATGTRFQRQIRTDRVRPQGRARAGTAGSQGAHSRGHSRNLSASSITSTSSNTFNQPDIHRRPPPLIMANDGSARARLPFDAMTDAAPPRTPPAQVHAIPASSVGGSPYTTSSIFAGGNGGSPHYASPVSLSRTSSGFWDGRTPARRLSVPTGSNPFLSHRPGAYPPPYINSTVPGPYSHSGAIFANPPGANQYHPHQTHNRPEPVGLNSAEAEVRRRTWHPSTYSSLPRPVSSGYDSYQQPPETLQPSFGVNGSGEPPPKLPGIESFDKIVSQQRPLTPPTRRLTPMDIDSGNRGPPPPPPSGPASNMGFAAGFNYSQPSVRPPPPISGPGHRRGHVSWDLSLHQNLTGLNIRDRTPQRDASHWGQQTIAEIQNVGTRPSPSYQPASIPGRPTSWNAGSTPGAATTGPLATRTSPEDSSSSEGAPTPSTASLEYHPAIVHSSGYEELPQQQIPGDVSHGVCAAPMTPRSGDQGTFGPSAQSELFPNSSSTRDSGMGRLEALVAVATRENQNATKLVL